MQPVGIMVHLLQIAALESLPRKFYLQYSTAMPHLSSFFKQNAGKAPHCTNH